MTETTQEQAPIVEWLKDKNRGPRFKPEHWEALQDSLNSLSAIGVSIQPQSTGKPTGAKPARFTLTKTLGPGDACEAKIALYVVCASYDSNIKNTKLRVQFNFARSLKERQWDRADGYSSVIIGCMPNLNLWMITPRRDECKHDGGPRDSGKSSQLYLRGAIADPKKTEQFDNFVAYAQAFDFLVDPKNDETGIQGFVYDQPPSNPRGPEDAESEADADWYGTGNQGVIASNEGIGMALWESFKQVKPGDRRHDLTEIAPKGDNALQPFPRYIDLITSGALQDAALKANINTLKEDMSSDEEAVLDEELKSQVPEQDRLDGDYREQNQAGKSTRATMTNDRECDIFISHSQQLDQGDDAERLAKTVGANLERRASAFDPSLNVTWTADKNPDHTLEQQIVTAIEQARVAVIFLSERSQPHHRDIYEEASEHTEFITQPWDAKGSEHTEFITQPWEIYHLLRRVDEKDDLELFIIPITSWEEIYSDGWPGPLGNANWHQTWKVAGAGDPSKFIDPNADLLQNADIDGVTAERLSKILVSRIWLRKSSDNRKGAGINYFAPDSDIFKVAPDNAESGTKKKHLVESDNEKCWLRFMKAPTNDDAFKELWADIRKFLDTGKGVK